MRVLLVLEDPTHDQFVVKPIIERLLEELGWSARVDVLRDPHLRGASDLFTQLDEIIETHPMIDLFIVVLDRDCDRDHHEAKLASRLARHGAAIGCLAVQEVEVWMLATLPARALPADWSEIRAHCDPKEAYAEPWLEAEGFDLSVGRGRRAAMQAHFSGAFRRVLSRCDELRALQTDLAAWRSS